MGHVPLATDGVPPSRESDRAGPRQRHPHGGPAAGGRHHPLTHSLTLPRGTLTHSRVQGTCKFGDFASAVEVHLVEVSPALRGIQRDKLGVSAVPAAAASSCSALSGAPVSWHLDLEDVPRGGE